MKEPHRSCGPLWRGCDKLWFQINGVNVTAGLERTGFVIFHFSFDWSTRAVSWAVVSGRWAVGGGQYHRHEAMDQASPDETEVAPRPWHSCAPLVAALTQPWAVHLLARL